MLSHDYNWNEKKKVKEEQDGLTMKKILARGWTV